MEYSEQDFYKTKGIVLSHELRMCSGVCEPCKKNM